MNKLGVYFGTDRQEALFRGDTSNTVVDPYYIYAFQAIGMHLCDPLDYSPPMARLQARYAQRAWEYLFDIYKGGDERLKVQGFLFFVYSLVFMGFSATTRLYLSKVCNMVNDANLQFLPTYGRPLELCDQVREDITVLSQTIYTENYFFPMLGGPEPTMTARLEREFRQDLQVRTPQRFSLQGLGLTR